MLPLYERYRPSCWEQVVGQDKVVKELKRIQAKTGLGGKVYYLTGSSGTGKTTLARLIAKDISNEEFTTEIDAQDVDKPLIEKWESENWNKPRNIFCQADYRCYIINEAHRMREPIVSRLLTTFELRRIQENATFIFTTTSDGADLFDDKFDACPFGSRALRFNLARRDLSQAVAQFVQAVAMKEQLDGKPLADYVRLAKDCRNNVRDMLCQVEAGKMLE